MKKTMKTILCIIGISCLLSIPALAEVTQSSRWVGSGDRWQVSDNQGGFIKDC